MKSKTSPDNFDHRLDTISSDGLQEGLIAFQLLEMGAPNSSMVKRHGRLKIFESYAGVLIGGIHKKIDFCESEFKLVFGVCILQRRRS